MTNTPVEPENRADTQDTATPKVHDNQFDTHIPESVVRQIIRDYQDSLQYWCKLQIKELNMDIIDMKNPVLRARRTAFMNMITHLDETVWGKPYIVPGISQIQVNDLAKNSPKGTSDVQ